MDTSYDTLSNFVNQEADYNFASGLEMLKKAGGQFLDATSPFSPQVSEPLNQDIKSFVNWVEKTPIGALSRVASKGAQAMQESGVSYGMPGILPSYVTLPTRMGILRESPFFQQMLHGPGPGSSSIRQVVGELNQGQNYAQNLRALAESLGVNDKSKLIQLLGNNAGK